MDGFFGKARATLHEIKSDIKADAKRWAGDISSVFDGEKHSHTHIGEECHDLHHFTADNCYHSFAPCRTDNEVKYYVDGCGYMWAVSVALEEAQSEIWIMDWWLSPELYLRRPPSANEGYRLDRMLLAAAQRGVKVNVLIYKEVEQALTLNSTYTKHHLEELHHNIAVMRHPDHNPSARVIESEVISALKNLSHGNHDLSKLPSVGLDDVVLFWAHHEKMVVVDGKLAFMGGLDLCFGRWDTNQHSIADAHPSDLEGIVFPGQDYNNARIFDFEDVANWERNKLDRTQDSRMGWSDISIGLGGPIVEDIKAHFVQRWNFIYHEKYIMLRGGLYKELVLDASTGPHATYEANGSNVRMSVLDKLTEPKNDSTSSSDDEEDGHGHGLRHHLLHHHGAGDGMLRSIRTHFHRAAHDENSTKRLLGHVSGTVAVQMLRSCTKWSHGVATEHSIANAYIGVIKKAKHFIYIENQFFITATGIQQEPIRNLIGKALVDRIVKAAKLNEPFKVIVCMPAVPAFAGDLHAADSLGTRAIMNLQYRSISRHGHSIIEMIEKAGVQDAKKYIRFYNLRNYDRINTSAAMAQAEQKSGVDYETARKEHDDVVGAGFDGAGEETGAGPGHPSSKMDQYQDGAAKTKTGAGTKYDTVSNSYMLNGDSIANIPWEPGNQSEIDAFVSEELYIHSKCLIADDRTVIIGSANLNDRSQLGNHDSEIAVVIEDSAPVDSMMAGQPYQASRFAAGLRRKIFRKHLGLIESQDYTSPDANFTPIDKDPNVYDWGSEADSSVADPLSEQFDTLWNSTAATNTSAFEKVFRPVPSNNVRNWDQYKDYYGQYFVSPDPPGTKNPRPAKYRYGHVFKEAFPGGVQEVKQCLSQIKGNLVDMPLDFLCEVEQLAAWGAGYNSITDDIYT